MTELLNLLAITNEDLSNAYRIACGLEALPIFKMPYSDALEEVPERQRRVRRETKRLLREARKGSRLRKA